MKSNKKIAAFFDFDGTIYDGVITFNFLKFLLRKRDIRRGMGLKDALKLLSLIIYYMMDKLNLAEREQLSKKAYGNIKGIDSNLFKRYADEFFKNEYSNKFFPEMIRILDAHKKKSHKVIIVTSALREIIAPVNKLIEIDGIIAAEVGSDNGIYNGMIKKLPVGKSRIKIIREYCKINGIILKKSYAYSDHHSDIPLLENSGNPVAVNPDGKLKSYAEKKGWRIMEVFLCLCQL